MPLPDDRPLRLLISFSPEDSDLKEQLVRHLHVLVRFAGIDLWTVDRVRAGDNWRQEVDAALDRADVALLLVSAHFLASDFLQDVEVPKLFHRREQGGLSVIPVLLRSCLWQAHPWLEALMPLPTSKQAIASLQGDDRDRVLTEIVAEIERRVGAVPVRRLPAGDLSVVETETSVARSNQGAGQVELHKKDDALWLRHLREAGLDLTDPLVCFLQREFVFETTVLAE